MESSRLENFLSSKLSLECRKDFDWFVDPFLSVFFKKLDTFFPSVAGLGEG